MDLWVIFLTGLTVGGLTCLAVQGGLLASVIAARDEGMVETAVNKQNRILPTLAFLSTKLVAYTSLGFLLGAFGGAIGINQTAQIAMQLIAGLYMIAVALNLLNIHPIFRYVVITPPKSLARKVRNQSRSKELFAPAILGAMTIFIPCGTTLAMEALAISSADPFIGAAIMAVFVLGTTPLFFGVGLLTSILGDNFKAKFLKIAAIGIIYLGFSSVNGALVAAGSPLSLQSITSNISISAPTGNNNNIPTTQVPVIYVTSSGYSPNYIRVKKDTPVNLTVISKDAYSCATAFRIPALNIKKNLTPNESITFTFTPHTTGKINFTCSMGMYTGVIEVI